MASREDPGVVDGPTCPTGCDHRSFRSLNEVKHSGRRLSIDASCMCLPKPRRLMIIVLSLAFLIMSPAGYSGSYADVTRTHVYDDPTTVMEWMAVAYCLRSGRNFEIHCQGFILLILLEQPTEIKSYCVPAVRVAPPASAGLGVS